MPILLQKVEGTILNNFVGELKLVSSIKASVQFEDYINLNGFVAFLQNFTEVNSITSFDKPLNFGLTNQYNLEVKTLEISYKD